jgi:hypothetical protein
MKVARLRQETFLSFCGWGTEGPLGGGGVKLYLFSVLDVAGLDWAMGSAGNSP